MGTSDGRQLPATRENAHQTIDAAEPPNAETARTAPMIFSFHFSSWRTAESISSMEC
jgi:hypothetical protein